MIIDMIIVGAGIAGMTAAIYARRAGKSVLILEKKMAGGQIVNSDRIKNYPGFVEIGGRELMENVRKQVAELGAEFRYEEVVKIEVGEVRTASGELEAVEDLPYKLVKTEEEEYRARAIILAIGREEAKLGVPGEELAGVSYCATCDGALYTEKDVAVIGGGNTALYEALYLAEIARKVYIIHRREEFRGDAKLVDELSKKENVEFVMGVQTREIVGTDKVEGVKVVRGGGLGVELDGGLEDSGALEVEPESGSEAGLGVAGEERVFAVDAVFVAVGQKPQTDILKGVVDLDNQGYVVAGEDCHTSCAGIYVAGDCRTKTLRQLVTAAADGAMAASVAVQEM